MINKQQGDQMQDISKKKSIRPAVVHVLVPILAAVSVLIGAMSQILNYIPRDPVIFIFGSLGGALPIVVLPIIWWWIVKFKVEQARGPLILWAVVATFFAVTQGAVYVETFAR